MKNDDGARNANSFRGTKHTVKRRNTVQVVIILEFCGFWDKLIRKSYEFVPKSAILEYEEGNFPFSVGCKNRLI
jgi:hypothetical protein